MFINFIPFRVSGETLEVLVDGFWIEIHGLDNE